MLGPRLYQDRIERAGCTWRPIPAEAEFDPSAGRAAEEQRTYIRETFLGPAMPAGSPPRSRPNAGDVLVIDAMLLSTVCAAQTLGLPIAALVHTTHRFHGDPEIWGEWGFDEINEIRTRFDQPPISPAGDTVFVEMQRRCDRELVVMPAEFDERTDGRPNVVHVGPIFEQDAAPADWDFPWAPDDPVPLVVVASARSTCTTRSRWSGSWRPGRPASPRAGDHRIGDGSRRGARSGRDGGAQVVPHVTVLPHAALVVTTPAPER